MPHILLVEDNHGDAQLIREMYRDADNIGEAYEITHVQRVSAAVALLSKPHDFDLILSDMSLPDSQGLETLNSLSKIASELPVIFMTGTNNEVFVSAAIKAGAQDYLVKGHIDSQVLTRTTAYSIERKKAQKQFEAANHKTAVLTENAKLLKQQKAQLLKLNAAKDEFISLASHQLRTPATGVKQYLGMVLEGYAGDIPHKLEPFLRTAYDANERQLNIINDLLKTAQLDSGRYQLIKQTHDVCMLVEEIIKEYLPIIAMRHQLLQYSHDGTCEAHIDAAELKVVVANLIENASKYSATNTTIEVRVERHNTSIMLAVKDQGVGIDERDVTKVFDKFTRLDNELSDTVNGSGLGLYFVKKIIKMHGGKINVESAQHQGSLFRVTLPL